MGEGALESNYLYPNLGLTSANCVTTGKLLTFTFLNLLPRLSLREKQHASGRRLDEAVNWEGPRATPGRRCLLEHIAPCEEDCYLFVLRSNAAYASLWFRKEGKDRQRGLRATGPSHLLGWPPHPGVQFRPS